MSSFRNRQNSLLLLFIITIYVSSCSDNTKANFIMIRELDNSLNISNSLISEQSSELITLMQTRAKDSNSINWLKKAEMIKQLSDSLNSYIDNLKIGLKKEAGFKMRYYDGAWREDYKEDDLAAAKTFFDSKGNGEELKSRIAEFKTKIYTFIPEIDSSHKAYLEYWFKVTSPLEKGSKSFSEMFFNNLPVAGAMAVLSKFKNNVNVFENNIITFCYSK